MDITNKEINLKGEPFFSDVEITLRNDGDVVINAYDGCAMLLSELTEAVKTIKEHPETVKQFPCYKCGAETGRLYWGPLGNHACVCESCRVKREQQDTIHFTKVMCAGKSI
jgi:hypothetical protein